MNDFLPVLNVLIATLLGGGGVYLWRTERRLKEAEISKVDVSATDTLTRIAMSLVKPLEEQIAELKEEVAELREQVAQYQKDEAFYEAELHSKRTEVADLQSQLSEARDKRDELEARVRHLEEVLKREGINGEET